MTIGWDGIQVGHFYRENEFVFSAGETRLGDGHRLDIELLICTGTAGLISSRIRGDQRARRYTGGRVNQRSRYRRRAGT